MWISQGILHVLGPDGSLPLCFLYLVFSRAISYSAGYNPVPPSVFSQPKPPLIQGPSPALDCSILCRIHLSMLVCEFQGRFSVHHILCIGRDSF